MQEYQVLFVKKLSFRNFFLFSFLFRKKEACNRGFPWLQAILTSPQNQTRGTPRSRAWKEARSEGQRRPNRPYEEQTADDCSRPTRSQPRRPHERLLNGTMRSAFREDGIAAQQADTSRAYSDNYG